MLTLTAVSDIHLACDEFYHLPVPDEADLILLAGDVMDGTKPRFLEWVLDATAGKTAVITIGNHECYGTRRDKAIRECRAAFRNTHINFLVNESIVINGVRIAASDLWTDFQLDGQPLLAAHEAEAKMNDYKRIRVKDGQRYRRLRASDTIAWYQEGRRFIEQTLNESSEPVILMTHTGISRKCVNPNFLGDRLNGAFTSDLEPLFEQVKQPPVLCVFGHTHHHICTRLDCGAVLYSNQRGYDGYEVVEGYDPERLIRIDDNGVVSVDGYPDL